MKNIMASFTIANCLLVAAGTAFAGPGPSPQQNVGGAPGQNGSNKGNSCGGKLHGPTPGNAANAGGSPFNSIGQAGNVYAGNPGTASLLNSNSGAAVAQYDVACF